MPDLQPRPPDMPAHARHLALQAQARHGAEEIAARRGGSSDAARTLVPAKPGQREGVALCRAVGRRQEDDLCNHADRQGGLSQRGVRGCRGQGAAQAPVPCRLAAQATEIKCLDEAAVLQRKKKRTQGRRRPSDAARTLVMCPARGRKSGHAQKDARQGQRARSIQQPAANPGMPYDLQARSESIGVDWSPLPCAANARHACPCPASRLAGASAAWRGGDRRP